MKKHLAYANRFAHHANTMSTARRNLKVEKAGDYYKGRTFPKIRLQGQWLARLGFLPNSRVEIIPGEQGELILKAVNNQQTTI